MGNFSGFLLFFSLLFSASAVADTLFSPVLSSLVPEGVTIPNAHNVDGNVYRGMLPVAYDQLKNQLIRRVGPNNKVIANLRVTDILILDSRINDNVVFEMETLTNKFGFVPSANFGADDNSQEYKDQKQEFRDKAFSVSVPNAPLRYFYVPLMWHDLEPFERNCKEYVDALRILKQIQQTADRRVFLHCTVGEDRTGVVSALLRLLNNDRLDVATDLFRDEMCKRGYEAGNPSKGKSVVKLIQANLTPFFLKMVYKIKMGELRSDKLDYETCARDPKTMPDFSQDPIYSAGKYKCDASPQARLKPADEN